MFAKYPILWFGLILLSALVLFGPFFAPYDPYALGEINLVNSLLPPGSNDLAGKGCFWLGTDLQGRDMLSAMLYGLRSSISVAGIAVFISFLVSIPTGLFAALRGGVVDNILMRLVDLKLSIPTLLLALVFHMIFGQGSFAVILALSISGWAYLARALRSLSLTMINQNYILAARCFNVSEVVIILKHLLPNCLPPLFVVIAVRFAHNIALEASLSFLGLGLPQHEPSLGLLVNQGFEYLLAGSYWVSVFPGLVLLFAVTIVNMLGDVLRDAFRLKPARFKRRYI